VGAGIAVNAARVAIPSSSAQIHLVRSAEAAWRQVTAPWLRAGAGTLQRRYVVVATRGQALALKQRCLEENLPLLGVEFLTPGLARRLWRGLAAGDPGAGPARPVMGRELLLIGLRAQLARRLEPLEAGSPGWGFWQSLASDAERALDDFDELLRAGRGAEDFALAPLREVFGALGDWVRACGYTLAPWETADAAAADPPAGARRLAGGVLGHLLSVEQHGEFAGLAGLLRRADDVTVTLPDPAFEGARGWDERWVERWQQLLGVEALPLDEGDLPTSAGEAVGELWGGLHGSAEGARVVVGRTRRDEGALVTDHISELLAAGAARIAVAFPRADAAHARLTRALAARGVPFVDLLEQAAPPPVDRQAQAAMLDYYAGGNRVDELLALWPWLRAIGSVTVSTGEARRQVERSFDSCQMHPVAAHRPHWTTRAPELARVAVALGEAWPDALPLANAIARFRAATEALDLEPPEGWEPLENLAQRDPAPLPRAVAVAALRSFVPEQHPVASAPGRGGFARVVLGTRRRLDGVGWSHVIAVEANAGCWPVRGEPSPWLTDAWRAELNQRDPERPGLLTMDDRADLYRLGWRALARDASEGITLTAALHDDADPEEVLAPNAWLERVLWSRWAEAGAATATLQLGDEFAALAREAPPALLADVPGEWREVWSRRRDPEQPFDHHFLGGDPGVVRPERLPARLIEAGVEDPAETWFGGVLGVQRIEFEPLVRTRRKVLGLQAHALLARALRPDGEVGQWGRLPAMAEAGRRLEDALADVRERLSPGEDGASFHAELAMLCRRLLRAVADVGGGEWGAVEWRLPEAAAITLPGGPLPVSGRLDFIRANQRDWRGADVDVFDFKTGGDAELSAARMARSGRSLQLGVYLAAMRTLGVAAGRVWMLKPVADGVSRLELAELGDALSCLDDLDTALATGVFGARTADRSPHAPPGFAWPLASVPVPRRVLDRKYALTYGREAAADA